MKHQFFNENNPDYEKETNHPPDLFERIRNKLSEAQWREYEKSKQPLVTWYEDNVLQLKLF